MLGRQLVQALHCITVMNPRLRILMVLVLAAGGACTKTSESSPTQAAPPAAAVHDEPHGGHAADHGGIVIMDGNQQHFEILLGAADGRHRVYFSTAGRKPLPASAMAQVDLTITHVDGTVEHLPMARDAADASWQAGGRPLESPDTRIKIAYRGEAVPPYQVELTLAGFRASAMPPPAAPATPDSIPAAPTHDHAAGHQHAH